MRIGFYVSGPAYEERDAGAAIEVTVFAAPERAGGFVASKFFDGLVLIAIVDDGTIVAREDN